MSTDPADPGDVMAPLRERYAHWLGLDHDEVLADRAEAAEDVRALQLVLRMERGHPPSWHDAVTLAASATALLCTDPRAAAADGPWHDAVRAYCRGHIRKVTRRARATQWQAVQDLPGITVAVAGRQPGVDGTLPTEVRALLPGRVTEVDKRVSKLQVGGTDAPVDDPPPEPATRPLLRMWFPPEPPMSLGKAMAQAGHAAMIAAALSAGDPATRPALADWITQGCPASARRAGAAPWTRLAAAVAEPKPSWQHERLLAVRDAGFTEIAPGTITVIAQFG